MPINLPSPNPNDNVKSKSGPAVPRQLSNQEQREQRQNRQFQEWLTNGSPDLRDAWVSVCPLATSNETFWRRLEDIVDIITTTGEIEVLKFSRKVTINLKEVGQEIQRLYKMGLDEADVLNHLTYKKIASALSLDAKPEDLQPALAQPKGNAKKFVITGIRLNGEEFECPPGYYYHEPKALGKERASSAKKQVPGATLAAVLLPKRAAGNMTRSTGLYTIDLDGVENLVETETAIRADPNTFLSFISITGSGLKVCVRGPAADTDIQYTRIYERLARLKAQQWGVEQEQDRATKDCSRLCFLAYDPEAYVNWDAIAVKEEELECVQEEPPTEAGSEAKVGKTVATKTKPKENSSTETVSKDIAPDIAWGEIPDLTWESISLASVLDAMRYVPASDREVWRKTLAALKYGFGDEAFPFADIWSSHGVGYQGTDDVRKTWDSHKRTERDLCSTPKRILYMARENGWKSFGKPGVYLPTTSTSDFCFAAYKIVRPTEKAFLFNGNMVTLEKDGEDFPKIEHVDPIKGIRLFEDQIQFLEAKIKDGEEISIPVALCEKHAKLLVKGVLPGELPRLNGVLKFAPLTRTGSNLEIAKQGYIKETGWFNAAQKDIPIVPLDEAVASYKDLFSGFDFSSPGDRSRALVHPIGIALKLSGLIKGAVPMDFGTANDQQSGKSLRQKLTSAFFNEITEQVVQNERGHGSTWENFQTACLSGRAFIQLDNFDDFHSPQMEAFLTGSMVGMRSAYLRGRAVDPGNYVVSISSNGLASRRDLALRSWFIAINKRPKEYEFRRYPEGGLLEHVQRNQLYYLGCVYAIILEWWRQGAQKTDEKNHSFWEFTQVCDWIAQNLLGEAPVMTGHNESVEHHSDAGRVLFARLWDTLNRQNKLGVPYRAGELGSLAMRKSLPIPGMKNSTPRDEDSAAKLIGAVAGGLFQDAETIDLGQGRCVERLEKSNLMADDDDDDDETEPYYPSRNRKNTAQYVFKRTGESVELRAKDNTTIFRDILLESLGGAPIERSMTTAEIAKFFDQMSPDAAGKWMSQLAQRWPENFQKLSQEKNGARRWSISVK